MLGRYRRRVPTLVHAALVAALVFVRLFRFGEGIELRYLYRTLNLWSDLELVPELFRLLHTTTPTGKFIFGMALGIALATAAVVGVSRALRYCEEFVASPRHTLIFAAVIAVAALLSPVTRGTRYPEHYFGAFGGSAMPRLIEEADFVLHVGGYRTERLEEIRRVQDELSRAPSDLSKLRKNDVLLFFIESYGATVRARPQFEARLRPIYDAFESDLERHGFSVASNLLDSPTYGGGSWLAHATLSTGVHTSNQFQFSLLKASSPRSLPGFFRSAGYRTVLVQPATTRPLPGDAYRPFDHSYFAANFPYRGPSFAYAPMPDQYVLDHVDRQELRAGDTPRFIEFTLVSSHSPWTVHAPIIDDWTQIGDGSIFEHLEEVRMPGAWSASHDDSDGYVHSIAYDLDVLRRYIGERIHDESLIIILGDHQPIGKVTLDHPNSPDKGVPIHVLSKNRAFVEAFLTRGYTRGMRPDLKRPRAGLQRFLPDFLRDFSTPR